MPQTPPSANSEFDAVKMMASSPQPTQLSWWQTDSFAHSNSPVAGSPILAHSPSLGSPQIGSPSLVDGVRRDTDGLLGIQKKPKMKSKPGISSPLTPRSPKPRSSDEDKLAKRIRESYACLRHRAMHKRCPAECPDRRIPKPLPVAQERRQVQQQHQLQQMTQRIGTPTPSSPLMSSPNTLRLLQGMQNARISSPQPPRANEYVPQDFNFFSTPQPQTKTEDIWQDSLAQIPSSWLAEPTTSWTDETWNDLGGIQQNSWSTEENKSSDAEDASPPSDLDFWLNDPAINSHNFSAFGEHDLSDVAQSLDSTNQILNELPEVHLGESPIGLLLQILLTRDQLERWVYDEDFNKSLRGFYVRVRIAEVNGMFLHRLGCVVEARDGCFERGLSGPHDLGKGLVVHFGSSGQHIVSLASVSNSSPNDRECEDWVKDAEKNHISIMPQEVQDKLEAAAYLNSKQQVYNSH